MVPLAVYSGVLFPMASFVIVVVNRLFALEKSLLHPPDEIAPKLSPLVIMPKMALLPPTLAITIASRALPKRDDVVPVTLLGLDEERVLQSLFARIYSLARPGETTLVSPVRCAMVLYTVPLHTLQTPLLLVTMGL